MKIEATLNTGASPSEKERITQFFSSVKELLPELGLEASMVFITEDQFFNYELHPFGVGISLRYLQEVEV